MRRVYYIINDKERVYCERDAHSREQLKAMQMIWVQECCRLVEKDITIHSEQKKELTHMQKSQFLRYVRCNVC